MHVMLDLETMGNGSLAPIITVGAVSFDEYGVASKFYTPVALESSMYHGMKPDASTILWWLDQSDDARAAFRTNNFAPSLTDALRSFDEWFGEVGGEQVWGNGAVFDNGILSNAYRQVGFATPWKFWNDRCYRTVKSLYPDVQITRIGTHHNAVDDAESQAQHLIRIANEKGFELK